MVASLRIRALGMLVLLLVIATVGGSLALESSYVLAYLALHVGLAVLLVGFSAHVLIAAFRSAKTPAKAGALIAFLCALGATIAGTFFLFGGGSDLALDFMEGLTVVGVIGIILILVWGSVPASPPTTTPA